MKKTLIALITIVSALLMVFGLFSYIEKKRFQKVGGRLIKVNYKFSKQYD